MPTLAFTSIVLYSDYILSKHGKSNLKKTTTHILKQTSAAILPKAHFIL